MRRRLIIDTDAKNEADDQFAIVHALLSPSLDIAGIVPAHFGDARSRHSMQDSRDEVDLLLRLLDRDDVVVANLHGAPAFLGSRAKPKPHRPLLHGDVDAKAILAEMYEARDPWYREVADVVVEVQPAHEAGDRPKWRLAAAVVAALVARGSVAASAVHRELVPS